MRTQAKEQRSRDYRASLGPALFSGAVQAVAFNPLDRALYLRVQNRTSLWCFSNWSHPFHGFGNAAAYRTIASGTYLFWQAEAQKAVGRLLPDLEYRRQQFLVGTLAGTMNGALLNPMQLVKFRMWSTGGKATFGSSFRALLEHGGVLVFTRGIGVSIARDVTFGVSYEVLRHAKHDTESSRTKRVLADCAAGMIASVVSSPFNFARNLIYGAPPEGCPLGISTLMQFLFKEAAVMESWSQRINHVNARLNIGWGTLRVGVGMACGQVLFRFADSHLNAVAPAVTPVPSAGQSAPTSVPSPGRPQPTI